MRLTQATNYSIRVLLYCAVNPDRPSRVADIAATFDMSETHLFKILKVLVDHKFIETIRGRHGGLKLGKPAEEIKLGDVIAATEESFQMAECFSEEGRKDCPLILSCEYNRVLREALGAFFAVLDRYTVADIAKDRSMLRGALGIDDLYPALASA